MKKVKVLAIVFFYVIVFDLDTFAQAPLYIWAKALSGNVEEIQRGIAVDNAGNVFITGVFFGTVDFDPGPGISSITPSPYGSNAYIAKYDINGSYLWAKNIAINTSYGNNSITIDDNSDIYITGYFSGAAVDFDPGAGTANLASASGSNDIYIAKYDNSGNYLWAKAIGSLADDRGNEIIINNAGNILLAGNFNNMVDFDPGPGTAFLTSVWSQDIFFASYDASGNYLWAKGIGGLGIEDVRDIAVDKNDNIFLTGNFAGTADFDPGAGYTGLISAGIGDIFIAKYDPSGNYLWAKQMGSTGIDCGTAISVDTSGSIIVTGTFNNTVDFDPGAGTVNLIGALGASSYLEKFDGNGNYIWVKALPLNTSNIDVLVDYCNNIYISGSYLSGGAATIDMDPGVGIASISVPGGLPPPYYNIFARYDINGNYLWADGFGRTCYCSVAGYKSSLTKDIGGYLYYSGIFNAPFFGISTVDFDPSASVNNLVAASTVDNTFFAKYDIECPLMILPVTLSSFTGENIENKNYLQWTTETELNNLVFEIERSYDESHFINIGKIMGSLNSNETNQYQFVDETPENGTNYYRLKQKDINGAIKLSNVISITNLTKQLSIYPNPSTGILVIKIEGNELCNYIIEIRNATGQLVWNGKALNCSEHQLNINFLPNGIYNIFLIDANQDKGPILNQIFILQK